MLLIVLSIILILPTIFAPYDNVAQIYDSTYGQDGDSTTITMNMDSESIVQSNFTHNTVTNNQRLYVNETGMYKLSYSCTWDAISGGTNAQARRIYENFIRVNGATKLIPSESDVYIRRQDGNGNVSATSATILVNLTTGDYVELRGGESAGGTNTPMQTDTSDGCFLVAQKLNTRAIEVYDTVGGQDVNANDVIVNLDTTYYNGDPSLYTLNANQINVSENGWYKVSYTSCIDAIVDSNRQSPQSWLRKNGNINISLSFSYAGYIRDAQSDRDRNCNRATTLINLSTGDYLELQTGMYESNKVAQVDTMANQSWLLMEKIELSNSLISTTGGGQSITDGTTSAVTFDTNEKLGDYVTHSGSSSQIKFSKSGLYEITYNIGYQHSTSGGRTITCGQLRKNGITNINPSKQCIYTRGITDARTGTVSTTSIINVSKDDYIEVMLSPTGDSVSPQVGATWITTTKINETVQTNWENTTLDIGTTSLNLGNVSKSTNVLLYGEGSNNVTIICNSGDCSRFTNNFTNGQNYSGLIEKFSVDFTCKDGIVGNFSAIYNITSNKDQSGSQLNVTCNVTQTYGSLSIMLDNPPVDSTSIIFQNETFDFNGTMFCSGTIGAICGNVSSFARYNISGGFENISTSLGATPFWTTSTQPQYCILNEGKNCSLSWTLNATGTIGTLHNININATSNFSQVLTNTSGNTTINISVIPPGEVLWSASTLNLGNANLNLGNITGDANIIPSDNHTNVNVVCSNGDCGMILDNFNDGINLTDGIDHTVTFTCLDNVTGTYNANFAVNSTEDSSPSTIIVSCNVLQTYGHLNVTLSYPPKPPTITGIKRDKTFNINSTIICEGIIGSSCGNVSATPRYENYSIDLGDGSDGSLTVTTANTIVNNYTYLTATENNGQTVLSVNDSTEFSTGDEILIIQMQDGGGTGSGGNYEYATISSTVLAQLLLIVVSLIHMGQEHLIQLQLQQHKL